MSRRRRRAAGTFVALAATLMLAGCPDRDADGDPNAGTPQRFEAQIRPIGASGITGTVTIEVDEARFQARVVASGLEPGAPISQHLNVWWDCTNLGRVLVNLDTLLSVPGEGPPLGDHFPPVDDMGRLSYAATRPVPELAELLHQYRGMSFEDLDVENRTIFLRDAGHRPIACGELRVAD